ncbi:glycosyltransferase [uncultured Pedobacter sp.]|uniref:glycosyltransferase family 2 protein n=1 Tax=uncultured Pedobacter sp. TaxID=246139 RepID=UPI0025F0B8C6|nr:glycosyltransferase [uncultured Pedobacter sp.]
MKVLIGITTKNRAQILQKAIDSALSQDYQNKEVWVFNDASTDDTCLLQSQYPQVNWVTSAESKGLMYARNLFMNQTGFELFCSLDDDAWFLKPDSLSRAVQFFENDIRIAAIGFDMLDQQSSLLSVAEKNISITNSYIGCGHVIRCSVARQVGLYTLAPGYYGSEEKDLCLRLIDSNYLVLKYNGEYVWHDKTNIERDLQLQHRSGVCNDLVFAYRRTPLLYLMPAIFSKIIKQFLFAFNYKKTSLGSSTAKGIFDFLVWLMTQKTLRKAVSVKGFKKYQAYKNHGKIYLGSTFI